MKKVLVAAVAMIIFINALGQAKGPAVFFRMAYMHARGAGDKVEQMTAPVTGVRDRFFGIGTDAYYKFGRILLGGDATVAAHGPRSTGVYYAEPFIGSAHVRAGYVLYETRRFFVYPSVGGGVGGLAITSYAMENHIKRDIHTIYLSSPSADFGINADWLVHTFQNGRATGAFMMGLRAGYQVTSSSDNWHRLKTGQGEGTPFSANTFYLALNVGAGNFRYK